MNHHHTIACSRALLSRTLLAAQSASPMRAFSTTSAVATKSIKTHRLPAQFIPPYPYGERRIFKQSNRGLYGNARIRFGNVVAEKYKNKTRRYWRPNVHRKTFFVSALGANVKVRLTLRVLKTIRREGGLDNYLLKSKTARLKELGPGGWNLRWLLMQTREVQERFNKERVALGLEPRPIEDKSDIVSLMLDYATPGNLSLKSQHTIAEMQYAMSGEFVLGEEDLADVEGVEELSDEEEARLIAEMESRDSLGLEDGVVDQAKTKETTV